LDRTHQLSFGGSLDLPAGFQLSVLSHFWSPLSASLVVPNTNLGPGEIFRTDFTGDGTVQDRGIDASNINSVLTKYNKTPNAGTGDWILVRWKGLGSPGGEGNAAARELSRNRLKPSP
jgi:hypothetical protein